MLHHQRVFPCRIHSPSRGFKRSPGSNGTDAADRTAAPFKTLRSTACYDGIGWMNAAQKEVYKHGYTRNWRGGGWRGRVRNHRSSTRHGQTGRSRPFGPISEGSDTVFANGKWVFVLSMWFQKDDEAPWFQSPPKGLRFFSMVFGCFWSIEILHLERGLGTNCFQ